MQTGLQRCPGKPSSLSVPCPTNEYAREYFPEKTAPTRTPDSARTRKNPRQSRILECNQASALAFAMTSARRIQVENEKKAQYRETSRRDSRSSRGHPKTDRAANSARSARSAG